MTVAMETTKRLFMANETKLADKSLFKSKSDAGKGDKPRNVSRQFWDNWDEIDWGHNEPTKTSTKTNKLDEGWIKSSRKSMPGSSLPSDFGEPFEERDR